MTSYFVQTATGMTKSLLAGEMDIIATTYTMTITRAEVLHFFTPIGGETDALFVKASAGEGKA